MLSKRFRCDIPFAPAGRACQDEQPTRLVNEKVVDFFQQTSAVNERSDGWDRISHDRRREIVNGLAKTRDVPNTLGNEAKRVRVAR